MGIFDNLMYPDNKNRAIRASELAQDCGDLSFTIANDKTKIQNALQSANTIIRDAYQSYAKSTVPYSSVKVDESWVFECADIISPVVTFKYAMSGLQMAAKAWLLRQGRIGEAAFADLVGLPRWLNVGKVMGGVAAAFAVEAIVDSIEGAVQRDKLKDAIRSLISPRIALKRNAMINGQVLLTLQSVTAAYQAITGIPGANFSKDQLNSIAQNLVKHNEVQITSFTDARAKEELAEMDQARGSWTHDD